MNFVHTEDRRMLADSLDRYLSEQYTFDFRNQVATSEVGFSTQVWSNLSEIGAIGALFSETDGGFGGDAFDIAVVFESLGRALVVEPFLGALTVGRALAESTNLTHRDALRAIIDGSSVVALAHDEPDTHYEMTHVATRAERHGPGWVLSGHKAVVQQGEQADQFLVSARTSGSVDEPTGISLFLVPSGAAGISVRGYAKIDGGRAAEVMLESVYVGPDALLAYEGHGLDLLEKAIGAGVLALCAEAVGAMEVAKEDTLEYLRTRKQFGVPIGGFQALQHRMADILLEIEQARSSVINAAAAFGKDRISRERALSAAKYSIGRIGIRVAEEVIQLHGGIGMTWELPLSHYAKRLVMIDHQLGDEDHHLQRYLQLGFEAD